MNRRNWLFNSSSKQRPTATSIGKCYLLFPFLTLVLLLLSSVPSEAQIKLDPQPFISSSGVSVGAIGLGTDGSLTAPALYFNSEPSLGLRRTGSQTAYFSDNVSATVLGIGVTGNNGIQINGGSAQSGIILASNSQIIWTQGNEQNTKDTGFSRTGAGIVAVGNGTQGNTAGQIAAALHIVTGSGLAVANVGANSCGTTTATIAGGANALVITVGATSGTQCRVAFPVAAAVEYDCAAVDSTTTGTVKTTPVDTTHTDFIGTFTAGDKITGICFPR